MRGNVGNHVPMWSVKILRSNFSSANFQVKVHKALGPH